MLSFHTGPHFSRWQLLKINKAYMSMVYNGRILANTRPRIKCNCATILQNKQLRSIWHCNNLRNASSNPTTNLDAEEAPKEVESMADETELAGNMVDWFKSLDEAKANPPPLLVREEEQLPMLSDAPRQRQPKFMAERITKRQEPDEWWKTGKSCEVKEIAWHRTSKKPPKTQRFYNLNEAPREAKNVVSTNETTINLDLDDWWKPESAAATTSAQQHGQEGQQSQMSAQTAAIEEIEEENDGAEEEIAFQREFSVRKTIEYAKSGQQLEVKYEMLASGRKVIQLTRVIPDPRPRIIRFPKIHVPEDVFAFVQAMDEVLDALHLDSTVDNILSGEFGRLHTANAQCTFNDFQMHLFINTDQTLHVQICTLPNEQNPEHKPRLMHLPLWTFHWLRCAIGELFVENFEQDIRQQLGEAPSLPDWLMNPGVLLSHIAGRRTLIEKTCPDCWDGQALIGKYMMYEGQKYFDFELELKDSKSRDGNWRFNKIYVPEDVFDFVQAMDGVLEAVHANREKIEAPVERQKQPMLLHTVLVNGLWYDFQMELVSKNHFIYAHLRTVPNEHNPGHKSRHSHLPLPQFHWLRQWMGEILRAEYADCEEELQQLLAKPPNYPKWLTSTGLSYAHLHLKRKQYSSLFESASQEGKATKLQTQILEEIEQFVVAAAESSQPKEKLDRANATTKAYPNAAEGRQFHIVYHFGGNGWKYLQLIECVGSEVYDFANVHVPEDVIAFVRAMDELLGVLDAKKHIIEARIERNKNQLLHIVKAKGLMYDFQMELYIYKGNTVRVRLRTVPNEHKPEHKSRFKQLHFGKFHWLRQSIGEILAEHGEEGVQQQLGKPPDYPDWLNSDGIPNTLKTMQQIRITDYTDREARMNSTPNAIKTVQQMRITECTDREARML